MTHASRPKDVLKGLRIDEGLVRLSMGSESIDPLLAELEEALS
jgi:cystathionine beta-lyase/cystathionine gamma-synthase